MQFFVILILIVFTSFPVISIDTKAKEAIVYDYNTQEVIFEKEADKLTYPASMTKIMTIYAVFDRIKNTNLSLNLHFFKRYFIEWSN